jgi:uncharacterized membrane protein
MFILFIGIIVFLGVHTLTTFRETRTSLIERFGLGPFKGLYSVAAIAGFALIVWGFSRYRAEGLITLWSPPAWTRHLTIGLMWLAFVALSCMNPAPAGCAIPSGCYQDLGAGASFGQWRRGWRAAVRVVSRLGGL